MICPKCREEMRQEKFKTIEYDQCRNCGGLWFGALEAEELVEIKGAAEIDTGSPRVGAKYNKVWEVHCPACSAPMLPVHDVAHPQLQLESCPACHGTFFDAGEFKDFCKESFMERVKSWLTHHD